jgi:hypothetical protein
MTEPTAPPRDEVLDQLVNEWLDLKAELDKREADLDDVAALIINRLPDGAKYPLPGFTDVGVRIQGPSKTLDKELAKQMLTPEQIEAASERVLTAAGVRKACPGWLVDLVVKAPATGKSSVRNLASAQRGQR